MLIFRWVTLHISQLLDQREREIFAFGTAKYHERYNWIVKLTYFDKHGNQVGPPRDLVGKPSEINLEESSLSLVDGPSFHLQPSRHDLQMKELELDRNVSEFRELQSRDSAREIARPDRKQRRFRGNSKVRALNSAINKLEETLSKISLQPEPESREVHSRSADLLREDLLEDLSRSRTEDNIYDKLYQLLREQQEKPSPRDSATENREKPLSPRGSVQVNPREFPHGLIIQQKLILKQSNLQPFARPARRRQRLQPPTTVFTSGSSGTQTGNINSTEVKKEENTN